METKSKAKFKPDPKLKLMDQFCQVLRYQYFAYRTEQSDSNKTLRYIKFHGFLTHSAQMGKTQIDAFLSHLATHGRVSAATQRQALKAPILSPLDRLS